MGIRTGRFSKVVVILAALLVLAVCFTSGATAAKPVIGKVTVTANNDDWGGACPNDFIFYGTIEVKNTPSVVKYHWERNDKGRTPDTVVDVAPGQTEIKVQETWTVGKKGQKLKLRMTLVAESGTQKVRGMSKYIPVTCSK
jgi:hypothetical protein